MEKSRFILPKNLRILEGLGQNIRLARLRRKMSSEQLSERAGIGRMTLYKIEMGSPVVAIGNYLQVLFILGLENDLTQVGANDPLGRKIQDAKLIVKHRAPKQKKKNDGDPI
ncbi:MAG: helix-turn-helix domain-containing protein [Bacteroidetes bacterium]|jgi:transcriptional regulator with XRE-family HTH domain|nr:helix-turn-helix domain-containing protein [Bacteroidota bacterium]MBK9320205.1 helix-turn-helix domain-containing protein [Bacteroidota bacterium]MBK9399987.1 helix-turn-helix domain-containing protein [Bacteroidota bacterium]